VNVDALDATMLGRWLVTTRGSTHIWDIRPDRVLYQRRPGGTSASFDADGVEVELTRIDRWPAVGHTSSIWFDDPQMPTLIEQWRQSSTAASITRLPDLDPIEETP
jgi:hypothetical protein